MLARLIAPQALDKKKLLVFTPCYTLTVRLPEFIRRCAVTNRTLSSEIADNLKKKKPFSEGGRILSTLHVYSPIKQKSSELTH
jgi:hypothetical protein